MRAGLVARPQDYRWSSARAHLSGRDDALVEVEPLLGIPPAWGAFLGEGIAEADLNRLRRHERTGRPLGDEAFLADLERALGRPLRKHKPGPKGGTGS